MSDGNQPSSLFIVDNSDSDWKVRSYLRDWCDLSKAIDIATGYFEIGSLLALDEKWQSVDRIRILMGDEVSMRTKRAFADGLRNITARLDGSLEAEKAKDDFLKGVPAIVEAIRSGKIQCRVYRRDKFHAKAYITHGRAAVVGSFGLVGSSNFTFPGLCDNVELNVQIRGSEVSLLQEWYERHWEQAEDITPDILRAIERHTNPRTPFEVWFKSLDEFFRGEALTPDLWDQQESRVFRLLDKYQRDAYKNLVSIANTYTGAFLCDGVGLGKTFVGLMLLERMVAREGRRVVLLAPKATREDVWERVIAKHLPDLNSGFVNFVLFNHTDLQRKGKFQRDLQLTLRDADVVIIDEAHHFRNPGIKGEGVKEPSRYRKLQQWLHEGDRRKQLFLLTATPINNTVHDFRRLIELFTNSHEQHFAQRLGIHSVRSHFIQLEKRILGRLPKTSQLSLEVGSEIIEAERALKSDLIFDSLVVQRSRAYVKESQRQQSAREAVFPERAAPQIAAYNLKATYGRLLESVERAFNKQKPLFVLSIYYPLNYWKGDKEGPEFAKWDEGRQKQVVTLIRTLFLKRFESSAKAFEGSCWRLLQRILAWVTVHSASEHDQRRLERWKQKNDELIGYVHAHQQELWPDEAEEDVAEEFLDEDILNSIDKLDPGQFEVDAILDDCFDDLNQLAEFLNLVSAVKPERDDRLKALIKLLKNDKVLKREKVLIFSEFADTARYIEHEICKAGITGVERIDGGSTQRQRSDVTRAWNLFGGLFYKAGGVPWKLLRPPSGRKTCYVGISFSRREEGGYSHSSLTQVFNDKGEGTILRGGMAYKSQEDHEVHLPEAAAKKLLSDAIGNYSRANDGKRPDRVVVHKSSGYDAAELKGFNDAGSDSGVEFCDLLALNRSEVRLFRQGVYPPLRGTHVILDTMHSVLYTRGSVPFYRKYPGPYVPRSLQIRCFQTERGQSELAMEVLALTKLNWNKTQFDSFYPITLGGSKTIGEIYKWCPDPPNDPITYAFFM